MLLVNMHRRMLTARSFVFFPLNGYWWEQGFPDLAEDRWLELIRDSSFGSSLHCSVGNAFFIDRRFYDTVDDFAEHVVPEFMKRDGELLHYGQGFNNGLMRV